MSIQRPTGTRGFTFVEMISTFTIILLVVAFLIPVFVRSRESARRTACASNLQQIGVAMHLYAQDYNGMLPPEQPGWTAAAMPYVKNLAVMVCPSEPSGSRSRYGQATSSPAGGGPVFTSYEYLPGLANDDLASTALARDWEAWHHRSVNVLFLGGNVVSMLSDDAPRLTGAPRSRSALAEPVSRPRTAGETPALRVVGVTP